jgi:hypothetical protein
VAIAAGAVLAGACRREEPPLRVTYYYLRLCSICQRNKASVSALPTEFGDRVKVELVESTAPGAEEAGRAFGFQSHGLVIHQGSRVIFHAADHGVQMQDVRAALVAALGPPARAAPVGAVPAPDRR